jgi:hypothetical protein
LRFYLRLEQKSHTSSDVTPEEVLQAIRETGHGWLAVAGSERRDLVNQMASRLPSKDVYRFLATFRHGLRSSTLDAGLTISAFREDVGGAAYNNLVVRAYVSEEREAALGSLGLQVANTLIRKFPDLKVADMVVWQHGRHLAVLVGEERPAISAREVIRNHQALAVLSALSGLAGAIIFLLAVLSYYGIFTEMFLGSDMLDWFKRVVGPIGSAFVTSTVGLYVQMRLGAQRRLLWDIQGEAPPRG